MKTLDLKEAARFLTLHAVTVQAKARSGEIPAFKPGRRWTFLQDDLVTYLRSFYPERWQTVRGDNTEVSGCHSMSEQTHQFGGFVLPIRWYGRPTFA